MVYNAYLNDKSSLEFTIIYAADLCIIYIKWCKGSVDCIKYRLVSTDFLLQGHIRGAKQLSPKHHRQPVCKKIKLNAQEKVCVMDQMDSFKIFLCNCFCFYLTLHSNYISTKQILCCQTTIRCAKNEPPTSFKKLRL